MTLPDDTRIGRVALRVNDLDSMQDFYESVIGLHILEDGEERAVLGTEEEEILVLIQDEDAAPRQRDEAGLFHTAFRVPDRSALGDVLNRIEERWELGGVADHGVSEALYLNDPEGNGIEVYRDRPQEDWELEEDGSVKMVTAQLELGELRDEAAGSERVPVGSVVGHVHLEVADLEASRKFYVDTLGFNVRQEMSTALFVAADDYHHHIGLNTWNHRSAPVSGRGLAWFELVTSSVEAVRERVEAAGLEAEEREDGFVVEDPDGVRVRVVE